MRICGLKFGHDGAVALIEDDVLIFSVELEKIGNQIRHCPLFDIAGVISLLSRYGYSPEDVDHFVLDGWNPRRQVFKWGQRDIRLPRAPYVQTPLSRDILDYAPNSHPEFPYLSYPHYAGHVVGSYCTSPFASNGESSFVLSWDGGMAPFLYYFHAGSGRFEYLGAPFSIVGDVYAELAAGRGPFSANPNQWETLGNPGKIMAYVAYGEQRASLMAEFTRLISDLPGLDDATVDEIYEANLVFIERAKSSPVLNTEKGEDVITTYHEFVQQLLVESLDKMIRAFPDYARNLCYAGGCALNIKWNQAVRSAGIFDRMWIPPFPNDAGSALGTACCAMMAYTPHHALRWSVYSGPEFIRNQPAPGWSSKQCSLRELAELIHHCGEPVLFLDGKAELGPRALGNRSILAPAVESSMKDTLNRIKGREGYRPVAPMCLEQHAPEVFDPGIPDPFMLYDHDVRGEWKQRIPAIQHLDGSARLQTVNASEHPRIFELLTEYYALSGVPLLCNTSANFKHKGFFPDLASASAWGGVNHIWSDGLLYRKMADDDEPTARAP